MSNSKSDRIDISIEIPNVRY